MAYPVEEYIDFVDVAKTHSRHEESASNLRAAPIPGRTISESNWSRLKLVATDVKWEPASCPIRNQRLPLSNGETKNMIYKYDVNLTHGLVKGNHDASFRLPLPGGVDDKYELEIDPSKAHIPLERKTPTTLTSAAADGRSALEVTNKYQKYDGKFTCKVYPKGSLLSKGHDMSGEANRSQKKTQNVFLDLSKKGESCVKQMQQDSQGRYYWLVRGTCRFYIDVSMEHEYL